MLPHQWEMLDDHAMYATWGLGLGLGAALSKALTGVQSVVEEWIDFTIHF